MILNFNITKVVYSLTLEFLENINEDGHIF